MPRKPPIDSTTNGALPSGLTSRSSIFPMVSLASFKTLLITLGVSATIALVLSIRPLSQHLFRYPETHPLERVKQFERFFEDSLKRADQIITDTETVRRELIETFNVQPKRVTAVALGVSDQFRPIGHEEIAVTLSGWGLNRAGYGLCVSALEPRKNVSELITA